jgi:copper(I)-binding protein
MVLCSGCRAGFALSFAPNGRYASVERWPSRGGRGRVSLVAAFQPSGPLPTLPACGKGRERVIIEAVPMKKLGIFVAGAIVFASTAHAYDYKVGALEIDRPWSRAVPKGAAVAAGYVTIRNTGAEPDRLVGGSTPVASKFIVHEMSMDKGVMKMRPVQGGLEIKPGETVELKPQSSHIMMMGLKQPIEKGKPFKGSLVFEKAGEVEVDFAVEGVGGAPAAAHDMHNMHH